MLYRFGGVADMNTRLGIRVAKCTTWAQLFRAALSADEANEPNQRGVYYSGWRFCSADALNLKLKQVRDGKAPLNTITRNHGLREKAAELLAAKKVAA